MPNDTITTDDIRCAMKTVALLIRNHGDAYWPLMERLQAELRAMEDREALLDDLLRDGASSAPPASFG